MFKGPTPADYQPYVKLITAAETLFQKHGFRATGINLILSEAGVARQTLYNHFSSKDGLIEAVLRFKSKKVLAWLKGEVERRRNEGDDPLPALLNTLGAWFDEKDFQGCIFARAALEYPDRNHPAHKITAAHTAKVFAFLEELCGDIETGLPCPGEHLLLIIEGATAVAAKTGAGKATAERAKIGAENLLFA